MELALSRKKLGEFGEMCFVVRTMGMGLVVAKPYGEPNRYDFLVDNGRRCMRVQVKTTAKRAYKDLYAVHCGRRTSKPGRGGDLVVPYETGEIDFLVLFLYREPAWYVIPQKALRGRVGLCMHAKTHANRGNCGRYEGAWGLLLQKGIGQRHSIELDRIWACADPSAPDGSQTVVSQMGREPADGLSAGAQVFDQPGLELARLKRLNAATQRITWRTKAGIEVAPRGLKLFVPSRTATIETPDFSSVSEFC